MTYLALIKSVCADASLALLVVLSLTFITHMSEHDDNADDGEDSLLPPASLHRPDIASESDDSAADSSLPAASSLHIRSSK